MSAILGITVLALFCLGMFVLVPVVLVPVALGALYWTRRREAATDAVVVRPEAGAQLHLVSGDYTQAA